MLGKQISDLIYFQNRKKETSVILFVCSVSFVKTVTLVKRPSSKNVCECVLFSRLEKKYKNKNEIFYKSSLKSTNNKTKKETLFDGMDSIKF